MDYRIYPFGDEPTGGQIEEFPVGEEMPDYMMPLSPEARNILEQYNPEDRLTYIMNSTEIELVECKKWVKERLAKQVIKLKARSVGETFKKVVELHGDK